MSGAAAASGSDFLPLEEINSNNSKTLLMSSNGEEAAADSKLWEPGGKEIPLPRLVRRDLPYAQSRNRVRVRHNYGIAKISRLTQHDWFHVLLRVSTPRSLTLLLSMWTVGLVVWAGLYVAVDGANPSAECGLGSAGDTISFRGAFAFSLQTSTTVGYTLPSGSNAFFENCVGIQTLIYAQMVMSMMFNAFLFAFFYTRIARADTRGTQILFSSRAIVSIVDDQVRFQVRIYDVDAKNPVVEAHIRMYAVAKTKPVPKRLRLIQPNDEFGSMLFLSLPAVASHHVDLYSLLHPPRDTPVNPGGLTLRQADSFISSRQEVICPVCGEDYGTHERWVNHVKYMIIAETNGRQKQSPYLHTALPKSAYMAAPPRNTTATLDFTELQDYFAKELAEVICIVEGIEPISSGAFTAIQSYRIDDIVFQEGARFKPCVENVGDGRIRVDLDRFHEIDHVQVRKRARPQRKWQQSMRGHDGMFFRSSTAPSRFGGKA